MEDLAMKTSSKYSRRQFVCAGTSGMAATIVAASSPARAGELEAHVQAPPPAASAPRILRKPPLTELNRIAKSYDLDTGLDEGGHPALCRQQPRPRALDIRAGDQAPTEDHTDIPPADAGAGVAATGAPLNETAPGPSLTGRPSRSKGAG